MRIFKYKKFAKFAKKQRISDTMLCEVVKEMEEGIIHADLGSNVFKQRIAREGEGKRGSHRSIILYKTGKIAFFVHGFSKADEKNITKQEENLFKEMAVLYLDLPNEALDLLIETKEFMEIV